MRSRKCTLKAGAVFAKDFHFPDFLFTLETVIPPVYKPAAIILQAALLKDHFSHNYPDP